MNEPSTDEREALPTRDRALEAASRQHFDSMHEAFGTAPYERISERTRRIYRRQIEGTVDAVLAVVAADEYEPSEDEGTDTKMSDYSENFTPYVAVPAEGIRVALATCKRCGTAVVWSAHDTIDILALHDAWHAEIKGLIGAPLSPRTTLPASIGQHNPPAVCP